jgi:hypothetical protein
MPHRLTVPLNSDGGVRIIEFALESEGRNGWVTLRIVRVEDDPSIVGTQDDSIHYLNSFWSARRIRLDGVTRYRVVGALGIRGYTMLDYVE